MAAEGRAYEELPSDDELLKPQQAKGLPLEPSASEQALTASPSEGASSYEGATKFARSFALRIMCEKILTEEFGNGRTEPDRSFPPLRRAGSQRISGHVRGRATSISKSR